MHIPAPSVLVFEAPIDPFIVHDTEVQINGRTILRQVEHVVVINNTVRNSLSLDDSGVFDVMVSALIARGITIRRVARFDDFFDGDSQFKAISNMPIFEAWIYADRVGLNISMDDIETLAEYEAIKKKIVSYFNNYNNASVTASTKYVFADKALNDRPLRIKKAGTSKSIVNENNHSIGLKQFETAWAVARDYWLKRSERNTCAVELNRGTGWNRRKTKTYIEVQENRVVIGCQTATRWQVEQAALQLGLSFE